MLSEEIWRNFCVIPYIVSPSLSRRQTMEYKPHERIESIWLFISRRFPFPLRSDRKRMSETFEEFPGLRGNLRAWIHALKETSGAHNVVVKTRRYIPFLKFFFTITRMRHAFCVDIVSILCEAITSRFAMSGDIQNITKQSLVYIEE